MSPQEPPTIARISELISDVSRRRGLVLVVAPHGYGKTLLIDELRSSDHPTIDFDASTGSPPLCQPDTMVLADDCNLDTQLEQVLALLDHDLVRNVIVTLRRQPTMLVPHHLVDMQDLSLDLTDVAMLASSHLGEVVGARVAAIISPLVEGWPLAVQVLLSDIAKATDPIRAAADIPADHLLLERIMPQWRTTMGGTVTAGLSQLAHLEAFNTKMLAELGLEDVVARAVEAGLPVIEVSQQWSRLIDPAQRALARAATLDPATLEAAVTELAANHRPLAALRVLLSAGYEDRARLLACEVPVADLDDENQQELIAVLRRLAGDHVTASPGLALRLARASRYAGHLEDERLILKRIGESATLRDEPKVEVEVLYHRAISDPDLSLATDLDEFESRCPSEGPVRTRWREAKAIVWAQQDSDWQLVERACRPLDQAAHDWIEFGDPARAAAALRVLATAPLYHLGQYRAAQAALRRALELPRLQLADRATTTAFLCQMSVLAGDLECFDSTVVEALDWANDRSFPWMKAYLNWSHMHAAAQRGEKAELEAHCQAALVDLSELRAHHTGVVFHAEAAALFAQLGAHDAADEMLAGARANRSLNELEVAMAELTVFARSGDLDLASAKAGRLLSCPILPPGRRWRIHAELAVAQRLAGDEDESENLATRATAQARKLGLEALAGRILTSPADDSGATLDIRTAQLDGPGDHIFIRVLGDFTAERRGMATPIPGGHVATLLKVLSLENDGPIADDIIIERLWPSQPSKIGLRRLKNVLSRLRSTLGSDAVIRHRGGLELGTHVGSDYALFHKLAHTALDPNEEGAGRLTAAMHGLAMAESDLLPTDLYTDWIDVHRRHIRTVATALFQYLLGREASTGPDTSWLLHTASRRFADDDRILVLLTRRALAEGDGACAREALEMAVRAAGDLGVSLTTELAELGPQLGVPAAG